MNDVPPAPEPQEIQLTHLSLAVDAAYRRLENIDFDWDKGYEEGVKVYPDPWRSGGEAVDSDLWRLGETLPFALGIDGMLYTLVEVPCGFRHRKTRLMWFAAYVEDITRLNYHQRRAMIMALDNIAPPVLPD